MSGLCSPPTHLQPALDEIERRDGGVGEAAGQDAAQAAQREVLGRPELARVLCRVAIQYEHVQLEFWLEKQLEISF